MKSMFPFKTFCGRQLVANKRGQYELIRTWENLYTSKLLSLTVKEHDEISREMEQFLRENPSINEVELKKKYKRLSECLTRFPDYDRDLSLIYNEIDPNFAYNLGYKRGCFDSFKNKNFQ